MASVLILSLLPGSARASFPSQPATFYFHKQASKSINTVTTTLWANTTKSWASSTQTEQRSLSGGTAAFDFYGQPSSLGNVTIQGSTNFTIYMGASSNTGSGTTITATLRDINSTGSPTIVSTSSLSGQIHTATQAYLLSFSTGSWVLRTNDILDFSVVVSASSSSIVTLYYDNLSVPSNVAVSFQSQIGFAMSVTFDSSGAPSQTFNKNATASARKVVIQAQIFDALGLYDLAPLTASVTNPSGGAYITNSPLVLIAGNSASYLTSWELNVTYASTDPSGSYQVTITAVDNSGVSVISQLSYSLHATWILTIRALQSGPTQIPVSGLQVVVFSAGIPVYFGISNSTGYVFPQAILPDNFTYTVDSYWNGLLINQTNLFRPASISLAIIIPLYQVDFSQSFFDSSGDLLQIPPSSFHLVYPDGSYAEPNSTGIDSLPAGTYTLSNVIWEGVDVTPTATSFNPTFGTPVFNLRIYELNVQVVDQSGHPVEGSQVIVFLDGVAIGQGTTNQNGTLLVHDLPTGQLVVVAKQAGQSDFGRSQLSLGSNTSVQVQLPLVSVESSIITSLVIWVIVAVTAIATAASGIIWYRRVLKNRRAVP